MATKGPAVSVYTPLISLLLLALALSSHFFQVTECARPSPAEEPRALAVPHLAPRDSTAGETRAQRPASAEAEGTAAASARDEVVRHPADGVVVVVSGNSGGAQMTMSPAPLEVLPRRFLSGSPPPVEGGADSASKSCHSNDPHIGCDPPSHS
ncbi:hypothetical protein HU200_014552 [Digitaria exilis]|uniref:Uncharacterized protein n=1 Tax=Digitaria exilis TaxID=1010633 RepID=A0A835FBC1_9POAL|nr:hypothetical protein HU200_014552 [Digitaria exilis]